MNVRRKILVAVDDPADRLALVRLLEQAGYDVLTANDGQQAGSPVKAVETAIREQPDLILLDLMIPGQDGPETCAILKGRVETTAIPVVFLGSPSKTDQIGKAFQAGGCDYVAKPVQPEELLARVLARIEVGHQNEHLATLSKHLADANVELATLSRIDPLTKLLNQRTWREVVEQEHERFLQDNYSYSIVMIDIDCFKTFNDTRGHQEGDVCLRSIAQSIVSSCRPLDSVGRYGGEEFIVIATGTQLEAALKLAERIRKGIWALAIPHPASAIAARVTISLGVAASGPDSSEAVLKEADDALYIAKRAGRNMAFAKDRAAVQDTTRAIGDELTAPDDPTEDTSNEKMSVLVVDDERTNRVICKGSLERAGYDVREAVDGHAALASVNEEPPGVIVMDVMMPNMDGLECTKQLKADPDTRDIPIIIVSALAESEDVQAGLEAGADEYLPKPVSTTELALRVRSMARQYQNHKDILQGYEARGEQVRVLMCLVEFCHTIGTSGCLDDVLTHTIEAAADMSHCRRISIMLPEGKEQHLRIAKFCGIDDEVASAVTVPTGEPTAGQVFASGRSIVINSEAERSANANLYDSSFFASVPLVSTPLGASEGVVGVLNITERIGGQPFKPDELEYIELIAKIAATAIHAMLAREAHDRASDSIMVALAKLAEHRDNDTGRHLDRVTRYCSVLAEALREHAEFSDQIDNAFMHSLVRAVPLHDIGKVAIPDQILQFPGALSADQMEVMRRHATIGANTIRTLVERSPGVGFLEMAEDITHYHHEWYDGSGYPLGLKADAIPLSARITALGDVYDALTTKRVYKEAFTHDKAMAIIVEESGTHFDPAVVDVFLRHEKEFAELAITLADEARTAAVSPATLEPTHANSK